VGGHAQTRHNAETLVGVDIGADLAGSDSRVEK
jgi:hypothetical protein